MVFEGFKRIQYRKYQRKLVEIMKFLWKTKMCLRLNILGTLSEVPLLEAHKNKVWNSK